MSLLSPLHPGDRTSAASQISSEKVPLPDIKAPCPAAAISSQTGNFPACSPIFSIASLRRRARMR
jgi:hypothetical protein